MRGKKIGIIIIIIFLIVAIVAGVFAYLFLATDIFKGNKKLFFNYISETVENVEKIADSKNLENLHRYNLHKYMSKSPAIHLDLWDSSVKGGWDNYYKITKEWLEK